jgi:hypothetical protein
MILHFDVVLVFPSLPSGYSWGFVAAMAADKSVLRDLMEQDDNFVNPLHIHLAQKLLHRLLYVIVAADVAECLLAPCVAPACLQTRGLRLDFRIRFSGRRRTLLRGTSAGSQALSLTSAA